MKVNELSITQYIAIGVFIATVSGIILLLIDDDKPVIVEESSSNTSTLSSNTSGSSSGLDIDTDELGIDCDIDTSRYTNPAVRDMQIQQEIFDCQLKKMIDGL